MRPRERIVFAWMGNMDLLKLWDQTNRVVRLTFRDGEQVDVRLLATDPPGHAHITYEVIRILRTGRPADLGTKVGAVVVGSADDVVDWQPVPEVRTDVTVT